MKAIDGEYFLLNLAHRDHFPSKVDIDVYLFVCSVLFYSLSYVSQAGLKLAT